LSGAVVRAGEFLVPTGLDLWFSAMSAFGGKADIERERNDCWGDSADITDLLVTHNKVSLLFLN
jgi:hypothetical protein